MDNELDRKQEIDKLYYINNIAKNWIRADCKYTQFKETCKKAKKVALRYDRDHKALRNQVEECTDRLHLGPLYKVRIDDYDKCMDEAEKFCRSIVKTYFEEFKKIDKK